jgi:hypothetical protein
VRGRAIDLTAPPSGGAAGAGRARVVELAVAGVLAAQLGAAAWLTPAANAVTLPDGTPVGGMCWFRSAFHVDCPLCGMTRSFVALAHGQLGAAFRFHPAGPLLFATMVVFVTAVLTLAITRARPVVARARWLRTFEMVAGLCVVIGVFQMVRS